MSAPVKTFTRFALILLLTTLVSVPAFGAAGRAELAAARELLEANKYSKAISNATLALALNTNLCEAYFIRGRAESLNGDRAAAYRDYDAAVACDTNLAWAYYRRGGMKSRDGEPEKAIQDYTRAIAANPIPQQFWNDRASAYGKLGKYEEAIADLSEAIRLKPNIPFFRRNRALHYSRLHRYEEALKDLNVAVRLDGNDLRQRRERADAFVALNRWEEAIADLNFIIRKEPDNTAALGGRASVSAILARWDAALRDYDKILEFKPNLAVRNARAAVSFISGENAKALRQIDAYLTSPGWSAEEAPYMALLGTIIYRRLGETNNATGLLEAADKQLDHSKWPYPLLGWMRGNVTWDELSRHTSENGKATEVHTYAALVDTNKASALEHLSWVRDHGSRNFTEYFMAIAELRRLRADPAP
jgi:tetratricopeptide (TPR) repeat protein